MKERLGQTLFSNIRRILKASPYLAFCLSMASTAYALDSPDYTAPSVTNTGVSAIWILANISYAGMRAQNKSTLVWRVLAFIFGFPGTLLSLILVRRGGERAYGIDLPVKRS